jgi:5'-3' exonuclease
MQAQMQAAGSRGWHPTASQLHEMPPTTSPSLHPLLLQMCVLAGCDFASSLPGIGIKKAHQHLRRTRCFLKVRAPL